MCVCSNVPVRQQFLRACVCFPLLSPRLHVKASLCVCFSLCVRPWDDVLLVSVLKGQNVSGVRKDKGKKDVLIEQISVVLLRTELLQRQHRYSMDTHTLFHTYICYHIYNKTKPGCVVTVCRYRELCRYLRVVQTDDSTL